jgi:hypothetical protein
LLSIKRTQTPDFTSIELSGSIDQTFDLENAIGINFKKIKVSLHGISRINSLGCREWLVYFHKLRCEGVDIEIYGIPSVMTSQINFIAEFILREEICSVIVPYYCDHCSSDIAKEFTIIELQQLEEKVAEISCTKCHSPAHFDEIFEDYFAFLS